MYQAQRRRDPCLSPHDADSELQQSRCRGSGALRISSRGGQEANRIPKERPVFFGTESSSGAQVPHQTERGPSLFRRTSGPGLGLGSGSGSQKMSNPEPRPSVWTSFLALFFVQMKIQREPLCCRRPWGGLSQGASGPWTVTLLLFCVLFTCTELSLGERVFFFFFFKLTLK